MTPNETKEQIFTGMKHDIDNHLAFPFEHNGTMFYLKPDNLWVYRVHMFSQTKSLRKTIENANFITNHLFDTIPQVQKLYGINPFKAFGRVVAKAGWTPEGHLSKSLMTEEGKMIDQYIYGISRDENELHRKH